jgi:cysteine desulfurase
MECYLDNAATTRAFDSVRDAVDRAMLVDYGNPSSMHRKGVEAERLVREARQNVADSMKVDEKEILFTSGGTESNNLALIGTALANQRRGKHIITTGIEHAAVYNPLLFLEKLGFEVTFLPVDSYGRVDPEDLRKAVRSDTILVSVMYCNNEVGSIEPVAELSKTAKAVNSEIIFHTDAIQAYGKFRIRPRREGIDLLSVSGHKIHGPKGSGFLYIRNGVRVQPLILGGGQQKDMRSGTENVPGCYGLGVAAKEIYSDFSARIDRMYALRTRLIEGLKELPGVTVNGYEDRRNAPHVVSASFEGIRSEVLLHVLEEKGIYVSSGSACSSNHPGISGTLRAIGVRKDLLDSTIRMSFGEFNTAEEVDYTIAGLKEILPVLRRFVSR